MKVDLDEARHLANEVHMDRSEWILAARSTIKALCADVERLGHEAMFCSVQACDAKILLEAAEEKLGRWWIPPEHRPRCPLDQQSCTSWTCLMDECADEKKSYEKRR